MDYLVIYSSGRKTRPLGKEEAESVYETFPDAIMLVQILKSK